MGAGVGYVGVSGVSMGGVWAHLALAWTACAWFVWACTAWVAWAAWVWASLGVVDMGEGMCGRHGQGKRGHGWCVGVERVGASVYIIGMT